ncbi:MAG TPA: gliding motility-associated C-terminal domain-containing protein [Flavipsychrobacter sp.]|nr:gliding motility-associated C-terminal domain-containing protein [Flavipsychrobacter sp.]
MRKCLVFVALLLVSQLNDIKAQSLFNTPDTICIRQPVTLTSNVTASTYYWGFCSGYLLNAPTSTNYGADTNLTSPSAMEIARDGANYFGFVADYNTSKLVRLSFGSSLSNTPVESVIGTLNNTMPVNPTKLFLTKDATGNWFMFVTGGVDSASSSIARVDFGSSLSNTPNSVNFGNLGGALSGPRGIFVQQEGSSYYGYVVNNFNNKLVRLAFGSNISFTPVATDLGNTFGFSGATDMIPVFDNNSWYAFATNNSNKSLTRLDFGTSITNTPTGNSIALGGNPLNSPSSLSFVRDCGIAHLFITNSASSDLVRVDMTSITGPYGATLYPGVGDLNVPMSITHIVRERDNVYMYVANSNDTSISRIEFAQCSNSSLTSSSATNPPTYSYDAAGIYNVYLAVNEGLPTMQIECRQIVVLPIPPLNMSQDTIVCQGDTIRLSVRSLDALSFNWTPDYNITKRDSFDVLVWPEYGTDYRVLMPFANGCVVDTDVYVDVSKNHADAGHDRVIGDGAQTVLGGPMTSEGSNYTYTWLPTQFISDISITNPVVNPPYDYTYYLEVRNTFGCYDIDTVVVRVTCNDINLPNAFVPGSQNPESNHFGLLNRQIVKLNYFRVFDRWGQLVFETNDVTKRWDGTLNGKPAPMGVYVWEADGFCLEGRRFKRSGNVTLIR